MNPLTLLWPSLICNCDGGDATCDGGGDGEAT